VTETTEPTPVTPVSVDTAAKPSGPVAAVMLAGGIGSLCLGLLTTLAEADTGIADTLNFDASIGPLYGKTVVTIITFFFFWPVLSVALWRKDPPLNRVAIVVGVLIACGFLLTFPKFFDLFAD
jgi:cytosine/uracil/thiamine/allantoin permease